jgi:hypothetical protein
VVSLSVNPEHATATEGGDDFIELVFSRPALLDGSKPAVDVQYTLAGTAEPQVDYDGPGGGKGYTGVYKATIAAGADDARVQVTGIRDHRVEGAEILNAALMATGSYLLAAAAAAGSIEELELGSVTATDQARPLNAVKADTQAEVVLYVLEGSVVTVRASAPANLELSRVLRRANTDQYPMGNGTFPESAEITVTAPGAGVSDLIEIGIDRNEDSILSPNEIDRTIRIRPFKIMLAADAKRVSANTEWSGQPQEFKRSEIRITTVGSIPDELMKNIDLAIGDIKGPAGYHPSGGGLAQMFPPEPSRWTYYTFDEPKDEKFPTQLTVFFKPTFFGIDAWKQREWVDSEYEAAANAGEVCNVQVASVFSLLTTPHQDGPGLALHEPTVQDYENAKDYIVWKYSLSTDLSSATSVHYDPNLTRPGNTEITVLGAHYLTVGTAAFQNENILATTLVHEGVHTRQNYRAWPTEADEKADELPAYQIELNDQNRTGLSAYPDQIRRVEAWIAWCNSPAGTPKPTE